MKTPTGWQNPLCHECGTRTAVKIVAFVRQPDRRWLCAKCSARYDGRPTS